jgi:hypothetical protein
MTPLFSLQSGSDAPRKALQRPTWADAIVIAFPQDREDLSEDTLEHPIPQNKDR